MRRRTSLELAIVLDESGSRTTKAAFPRKKLRVCRTDRLPIAVERAIALDGSRSLPDRRYEARSQGNRCSAHRFTCVSAHRIRCSPLRLVLGCQNRCFYACPKAALHYSRSIESGSEARTGLSAPIFPVWYRFFSVPQKSVPSANFSCTASPKGMQALEDRPGQPHGAELTEQKRGAGENFLFSPFTSRPIMLLLL